tara:strand:+ start:908 stop:1105 length:198 start_codon:yes stop_codon:yes gene_type:complete
MKISKEAAQSLKFKSARYGISYIQLHKIYQKGLKEYFVSSPENSSLSSFAMSRVNSYLEKIPKLM